MVEGLIAAVIGVVFGVGGTVVYEKRREAAGKTTAEKEIARAKSKASDIVLKAKDEALSLENERRKEWKKTETRLAERETSLDKKMDELDRLGDKPGHVCHFGAMHKHVLAVAGAEFQLTQQAQHFFWNAGNTDFAGSVFTGTNDFFFDLLFGLCNDFFNAARVNTVVFHEHFDR